MRLSRTKQEQLFVNAAYKQALEPLAAGPIQLAEDRISGDRPTPRDMLSVIIPTRNSERALVPTLAALVPGATAGRRSL